MAFKATLRIDARCPKHLRFNPELNGPGAVKGGCQECQQMVELYQLVTRLKRLASGLARPARRKAAVPQASAGLLSKQ